MLAGPVVFAVADGMGGHAAGEVASTLAISHLARLEWGCSVDEVLGAVSRANADVIEQGHPGGARSGMGTTLTGLALVRRPGGGAVMVFNVGDSRTYRIHAQQFVQITSDHSLVAEMVRDGELEADQAEHHPARHIVTRALGLTPAVDVDHWLMPVVAGDGYLVCSDGLTNEVGDEEIAAVVAGAASEQAAVDALIDRALAEGARDNVSAVLVRVDGFTGSSTREDLVDEER